MRYPAAMSVEVERARAAIRAIAADTAVADAFDALQEIGAQVMREIETLSTEAAILKSVTAGRTRDAG